MKSRDRFLTSLSRVQVEVNDQHQVPLLKFWVRWSPIRPLPPWAEVAGGRLAEVLGHSRVGRHRKGLNGSAALAGAPDNHVSTDPLTRLATPAILSPKAKELSRITRDRTLALVASLSWYTKSTLNRRF